MANMMCWYQTAMPEDLINVVLNDLKSFDNFTPARTINGNVTYDVRDSKTNWIPAQHWITGLCWHYVMLANKTNYLYDIDGFENEGMLQYTSYEPGEYYNWHVDGDLANCLDLLHDTPEEVAKEKVRKLSFVLQLSSPEEYTGGEMQIQYASNDTAFLPKTRGSIAVFDSRCLHRVKKVLSGRRKSIVGWVSGPRWK